jgi:hypothetical protein
MASIPGILTPQSLTLYFDGQSHTVLRTDTHFPGVLQAYRDGNVDAAKRILCKQDAIAEVATATSDAKVEVRGGVFYIDDQPVHGAMSSRLVEFMRENLPFQPLVEFVRKIRKNPSFRAVNSLYGFLEANHHPLLENGNFLAYKRVRQPDSEGRMLDIHSGTMDNRPGSEPRMQRNQVNEDPTQTCSYGLHVANWDYACNSFGSKADAMLEVEVNPEDVVAIPHDYNESKMRTCGYKVLRVVQNPNPSRTLIRSESYGSDSFVEEGEETEGECGRCGADFDGAGVCEDEECPNSSADEDDDDDEEEEESDEDRCRECNVRLTWREGPFCYDCREEEEEPEEEEDLSGKFIHDEGPEPEDEALVIHPSHLRNVSTESLGVLQHLVIDENQQNLLGVPPASPTVVTADTGAPNVDQNPSSVSEVLAGHDLIRMIPTDSLKVLLQTFLVGNDPGNAPKIVAILKVLKERGHHW